jgi:CO/xanthine dehydrogenase Mo-binding subunit
LGSISWDKLGHWPCIHGEITLQDSRVEQSNFDTYQILRLDEPPAIDVHIAQSTAVKQPLEMGPMRQR